MAVNTFKIYTINGINYDAIIQKYRQLCEQGEVEISSDSLSVFVNSDVEYIQTRKSRKPLKDDTRILNKVIFLVHTIAYRQITNREEGVDWESPLATIMEELAGMDRLFIDHQDVFFPLICKLEGLFSLTSEEDFFLYRRTIFECLSLIGQVKKVIIGY